MLYEYASMICDYKVIYFYTNIKNMIVVQNKKHIKTNVN